MKKIYLLFILMGALTSYGQHTLSLPTAINTALQNSFNIQLAKNNLEIASINNHNGVAGKLPTVTIGANDNEQIVTINQKFSDPTRNTIRSNVGSNNLSSNITGSMVLYNGQRIITTKKRLAELQQQNQYQLSIEIQNTIAGVTTRYYDIVRQQDFLKNIIRSIDVFQKRLEIVQARQAAGLSNNADLYQAKIDLNTQKQLQQAQELVISQAKTDLLGLLFLPPDSLIHIADTIIIDRGVNLAKVRSEITNNPEVTVAAQQIKINQLIEKELSALRYPTLRASTGFNFSNNKSAAGFALLNQSYGPFVGINLSIPLYNGTASKRQQQVAGINSRSAALQKDNLLLSLDNSVIRTYQTYTNTIEQIKSEQANYQLSLQLVDLVLKRLELGQATIIDVKQAQQSFETTGFRLVNLSYTAKAAEIELKRLGGQLGK